VAKDLAIPFWNRMPTIFAAARELGGGIAIAYALQLVSAVLAAAAVWHGWRRTADPELRGAIFIFATLAATPYAWDYDLIMLNFAAVWLWTRGKRVGFLPYEKSAIALLFIATMLGAAAARLLHVPLMQIAIWLSLYLSLRHVHLARTVPAREPVPV
jgi:alpha-1,2-mannosyltransferase